MSGKRRITLDEALGEAATQIDQILQQRWDTLALTMFHDSVREPPNEHGGDDGPGGPLHWRRVSFNDGLLAQKSLDLQWRAETLAQMRADLIKEFGGPSRELTR
jgi:hypothetical protein